MTTATTNGYHLDPSLLANVPGNIISLPQWVLWEYQGRGDKPTKIPYQVSGQWKAKSDDPMTWATHVAAVNAYKRMADRFAGIGFMFKVDGGLVGVDLDHSLDANGELLPWAEEIFTEVGGQTTYGEISPSGDGLKLTFAGELPASHDPTEPTTGKNVKGFGPDKAGGVEMYQDRRFFTVTGRHFYRCAETIGRSNIGIPALYKRLCDVQRLRGDGERPRQRNAPGVIDNATKVDRCWKYLTKCPEAISGAGGHTATFRAACETVRFDLSPGDARSIMDRWNAEKCDEKWKDHEIEHKLKQAEQKAGARRGIRLQRDDDRRQPRSKSATVSDSTPAEAPVGDDDDVADIWIPTPAVDLIHRFPSLRPPLIEGVLRRGENANTIAPPKAGKSWLVTDLSLAVATGRMFLGKFATHRGKVLVFDNELHPETSASRIPKVAAARGILTDEYRDNLFIENLRGKNVDLRGLGRYLRNIDRGEFSLIVLDAWYRFAPVGTNENDNGQQTELYNTLDGYAEQTGASFVVIHHSSKGVQGNKSVVDVGAGAGSMARATDAHLVMREHMEEGAVVIEAAVRSWPQLAPFVVRRAFPVFNPDDTLDPTMLRVEGRRGQRVTGNAGEGDAEQPIVWTPESFTAAFITADGKTKDEILVDAEGAGLSAQKGERFLGAAVAKGVAFKWSFGRAVKEKYATERTPPLIPSENAPKSNGQRGMK